MSVSEYLERARACADIAERSNASDKKKLLEIADASLKLAEVEAKNAAQPHKRITTSGHTKFD